MVAAVIVISELKIRGRKRRRGRRRSTFRHNEILKLFRLQLGRDYEVDCNNIVTDLSMRTMNKSWTWSSFSSSSSNLKIAIDRATSTRRRTRTQKTFEEKNQENYSPNTRVTYLSAFYVVILKRTPWKEQIQGSVMDMNNDDDSREFKTATATKTPH